MASPRQLKTVVSIVIGLVCIVASLVTVIVIGDLSPQAFWIMRVIVALGAGLVAAGILGTIEIEGSLANISVKAGGPFAFAVLVYALNPPQILIQLLYLGPAV